MDSRPSSWTLADLAAKFGGVLQGDGDTVIRRPVPIGYEDREGLTFATNEAYFERAANLPIGGILVPKGFRHPSLATIEVSDPRAAFNQFLSWCDRPMPLGDGIHPTAIVHPTARIDAGASIGPYVVIEREAVVGHGARVFPHCYVGERCRVGDRVTLYPHVVLYRDVKLNSGATIHAGAILGADGFGYVWAGQNRQKVSQVGGVVLGEDTEVGALTTIDRATAGDTRIGSGTKLDNLIQVGHNCDIGENCAFAALTGMSGSTKVGNRVVFGGSVGTNDHSEICDDVIVGGQSGVTKSIKEPGAYWGTPVRPMAEALRIQAAISRLPALVDRIRELERKVAELEETA